MTPAFTVTITADSPEQLHANLRAMLPDASVNENEQPFQDLLIRVAERADAEGYDMEVWKKGERETKPASTTSEKKKELARAKLRGELSDSLDKAGRTLREDLIESLAEATHATAVVKNEVEDEFYNIVKGVAADHDPAAVVEETQPEATKPKRGRPPKSANGKEETPDQIKARTIIKLQELYSAGKKAEVNKILAQYGEGSKTFSSIPAEQFPAIAEAAEAI